MPHARRALAFFSRKHFWHSLKKHVVGFKVVFKKQSSFFSETSSLNPINIQELNRYFLASVPGKDPHIWSMQLGLVFLHSAICTCVLRGWLKNWGFNMF